MRKNLLYNINPYSQAVNIIYVRKVLKEMVAQRLIQEYYFLTDEKNDPIENPVCVDGKLILTMPLPAEIDGNSVDIYVADHTKVLFNTLLNLDLYGIVRVNKKIYVNNNYTPDTDDDDYGVIFLEIKPDYRKFLFVIAIYMLLIVSIIYYVYWI